MLLLISVIGGLFGGFLSALNVKSALDLPHKKIAPKTNRVSIYFGFLRQTLLGMGSAIVVIGLLLILPTEFEMMTYISFSIASGFGGGKTLSMLSERITEQADKILQDLNKK